jgi:hypothetical protein
MVRIASYVIRIMGPDNAGDSENQEVVDESLPDIIQTAELNISDALPEGYYGKIDDA